VAPNAFRAIVTVVAIAVVTPFGVSTAKAQTREARIAEISSLTVRARPIESFDPADKSKKQFGALEFRSGLILTSSFKGFGGLSAIRLDAEGASFTALSDKGDWFTGTILYDGKVMTGLADVKSAPMLGADGKPIQAKGWFDSESLAFDGAIAYVGLERVNRILRFDFAKGGILSRSEVVATPPAIARLPYNKGLEALVFVPQGLRLAGTLIAISERGLDKSGNLLGFLIGGPDPGQFTVRRSADFDISDCALLPSGDLLLLERKFSLVSGVGIRIRRIPLASLKSGALVDGPSIFEADLGEEIDNMEGLDVHRDADGNLVLTMISDDNFSMLQRTLLLQFRLVEP
jgi:hypothetical protein